jgi:hypothetical protein
MTYLPLSSNFNCKIKLYWLGMFYFISLGVHEFMWRKKIDIFTQQMFWCMNEYMGNMFVWTRLEFHYLWDWTLMILLLIEQPKDVLSEMTKHDKNMLRQLTQFYIIYIWYFWLSSTRDYEPSKMSSKDHI